MEPILLNYEAGFTGTVRGIVRQETRGWRGVGGIEGFWDLQHDMGAAAHHDVYPNLKGQTWIVKVEG